MTTQDRAKAHYRTPKGLLSKRYDDMSRRVRGKLSGDRKTCPWLGLPCLDRDSFLKWATNHPDYLRLFRQWETDNYARRSAPSVHRIDSSRGYLLDNIAWVTQLENSLEALEKGKETRKKKRGK